MTHPLNFENYRRVPGKHRSPAETLEAKAGSWPCWGWDFTYSIDCCPAG